MTPGIRIIGVNDTIRKLPASETAGETQMYEEIDITDFCRAMLQAGERIVVSRRRVLINGTDKRLHRHRGWTLQFAQHIEGSGQVNCENGPVQFSSGALIAIPPDVPHSVGTPRGYPGRVDGVYISYPGDKTG